MKKRAQSVMGAISRAMHIVGHSELREHKARLMGGGCGCVCVNVCVCVCMCVYVCVGVSRALVGRS